MQIKLAHISEFTREGGSVVRLGQRVNDVSIQAVGRRGDRPVAP